MIKADYSYHINGVKEIPVSDNKTMIVFTINDKVKDGSKFKNQYWNCACFDEVKLIDGMKVKVNKIDSLTAREYNDKIYINVTVSVSPVSE